MKLKNMFKKTGGKNYISLNGRKKAGSAGRAFAKM